MINSTRVDGDYDVGKCSENSALVCARVISCGNRKIALVLATEASLEKCGGEEAHEQ